MEDLLEDHAHVQIQVRYMGVKIAMATKEKLCYVIRITVLSTENTVIGAVGLNVPFPVEVARSQGLDDAIIHRHNMEGNNVAVMVRNIHHATVIHAQ